MSDKFDPYREALVIEMRTIWPSDYDELEPAEKARVEQLLHAKPQECAQLDYVRQHTGFCRQVTVTPADVARVLG